MRYENLNRLIRESSSSRRYFLSLPVSMQVKLHAHNETIHTADELHRRTDAILKYERRCCMGTKKKFTPEELKHLQANPYTLRVTASGRRHERTGIHGGRRQGPYPPACQLVQHRLLGQQRQRPGDPAYLHIVVSAEIPGTHGIRF